MAETNLRQAVAKANSVGLVSEKDLKFYKLVNDEEKETTNESEADGIKGSVTVKTGEFNDVRYNVKVAKKTKAGADNKAYPGILTVKNEYNSIASCAEGCEPDRIRVSGDINLYQNIDGQEVVSYKSNFFNRVKADDTETVDNAEFDIEGFIYKIIPEMNTEGEETGRLKVTLAVPTFSGCELVTLIAPQENGIADAIDSDYEVGQTVNFWGDIVNERVVKITEVPVKIGKPKTKKNVSYKNELVITGAAEPYEEGISQETPYDAAVIKAALQERENKLQERKAKAQSGNSGAGSRPSGASKGRSLGF